MKNCSPSELFYKNKKVLKVMEFRIMVKKTYKELDGVGSKTIFYNTPD